ncbi:Hypothetical_protein [Hexamita inflata]|uniref:Hypothetical_protein n=1 Tax=Hexamita inflata TaxID=28002 RepID=A0ABP1K3X3_9EUKA
MFSNYDIKTYLSCLSFYERTVKDDEDSEEESNSEQESEDEILSEPDENSQIEDSTIDFAPVPGPKIVDETKPSSITAQLVNEFLLMVEKLFIRHMPDFSILSLDESLIPCKCKCCHKVSPEASQVWNIGKVCLLCEDRLLCFAISTLKQYQIYLRGNILKTNRKFTKQNLPNDFRQLLFNNKVNQFFSESENSVCRYYSFKQIY